MNRAGPGLRGQRGLEPADRLGIVRGYNPGLVGHAGEPQCTCADDEFMATNLSPLPHQLLTLLNHSPKTYGRGAT